MCGVLALLFIAVPAIEIYLIIKVGSALGAAITVAIIFLTGIAGAALARHQGLAAMNGIRLALSRGEQVGRSLIEGALVLCAGCLLLTPGFVTDAVGFALLVPPIRAAAAHAIAERYAARARSQIVMMPGVIPGIRVRPANPDDDRGADPDDTRDDEYGPPPPGVIDV